MALDKPLVIGVTAAGSGVAQVVLDGIHASSLDVRVVGFETTEWAKGIFECDAAYKLPLASDPRYKERLIHGCLKERVDLLIPGSEPELPVLAEIAPELAAQGCKVLVSSPESIRLCQDKKSLYDFLAPRRVPFVTTWLLSEALPRRGSLPYPLILKPRRGSGSKGVQIIAEPADWDSLLSARAIRNAEDWVVQPYVRSITWDDALWESVLRSREVRQKDQFTVQLFLSEHGEILGRFASLVTLKNGVSMTTDLVDEQPIWDDIEGFVAAFVPLGVIGPLNIQGIWSDDGICFFEANLRFSGSTQVRGLMGYREVEAAVRYFGMHEPPSKIRGLLKPAAGWVGLRQMTERVVPKHWLTQFKEKGRLRLPLGTRRILITGGTGYLGQALIRCITEADVASEIIVPVRDLESAEKVWQSHPQRGRVRLLEWNSPDELPGVEAAELIIHAAAIRPPCADRSEELFHGNLALTLAAVKSARRYQTPFFVFISSQSVYTRQQSLPWCETTPVGPASAYGYAKAAGEAVVQMFERGQTRWAILRIGRLYGWSPQVRWEEVPGRFVSEARRGRPLPVFGDGQQMIDLVHVRDAAEAVVSLLNGPVEAWNRVYNIGGGDPITILALAELCRDLGHEAFGMHPSIEFLPTAIRPPSWGLDIRLAREVLGWSPKVDLVSGLMELMDHCDDGV